MDTFIKKLNQFFGEYPFSVIFTNLFAVLFCIAIGWLCFATSDNYLGQVYNGLTAIIGALLGWALGMFFAPYDKQEKDRFSSIGQAVSVFMSGYAISKLDRFLEATLFQSGGVPNSTTWVRCGIFFCSMLLIMLTVFSNRAYFRVDESGR